MSKTKAAVKVSNKSKNIKVRYKNKDWEVEELLEFMALRIKELEKHQCKPKAACLFEGQKYLENKYIPNKGQTEFNFYE